MADEAKKEICSWKRSAMDEQENGNDRLKRLYPAVREDKTPLPRAWSTKEKYNYIGLSQNNLRVHYKGHGKTHRDAASVQASHPIPSACGLYYFEAKIVSKGRDGYMGIGLSAQGVNMNRLPGWDKQSYGYHGDDGHSFCSSGTGQPYGPTFTTGDVIGCGVNLVEGTCFYTKNGHHLGIAFKDVPPNLYPTVGLQTPGEIVDANFGQEPFLFDVEDMMNEMRAKTRMEICDFPVPDTLGEWQDVLGRIVSSYLVHHGYCNTAEVFSKFTDIGFTEDISSIRNRKRILKLVLAGRMSEAIERTFKSYPGLLENNQNLLFVLKCRQFVEMVNGCDFQVERRKYASRKRSSTPAQPSVIQSTKNFNTRTKPDVEELNRANIGQKPNEPPVIVSVDSDVEMEVTEDSQNGFTDNTNGYRNGNSHNCSKEIHSDDEEDDNDDEVMDVDELCNGRASRKPTVEKILAFGRELYAMNQRLSGDKVSTEVNQKMLENAFSLLAYSNPWSSPVGWQLDPSEREIVCACLNSAILESKGKPKRPPLEMAVKHAQELVRLMSSNGLPACAFTTLVDLPDDK